MDVPVKNIVSEIDLKPADALLPLFEAVVNAIHSLKLSKQLKKENKRIQIQIFRDKPMLEGFMSGPVSAVKVIDFGEGFTDANLSSFRTAFTHKNKDLGCKGIGRFTVLAAFRQILIRSNYQQNTEWKFREISLHVDGDVNVIKEIKSNDKELKTVVELNDCYNPTVKQSSMLSLQEIAEQLMHHCLVYYLCGDFPAVEILDMETGEQANINEFYTEVATEKEKDFKLRGESFKCYITKVPRISNRKHHYIYYCANSRVVGSPKYISRVNSLFSYPIIDGGHPHFLDVYVVSDYLNKKVYSARNGFAIPQEKEENSLFSDIMDELTFDEIETAIAKMLEAEYDDFVRQTQDRNIKELKNYITLKAPRYNRFLNRPEILEKIPPNLTDDKKEEVLYKIAFNERKAIDAKIERFVHSKSISEDTIEEVKKELIEKTAFDADSLADYMMRRKAILDIFKKFLEADEKGNYKLEGDIHNIIFPMGVTMDEVDYESHNLWLLDERFATYNFIASDKPITTYSQKNSKRRTDIVMTNNPPMFDNPISFGNISGGEISSMVVFEFKRPGDIAHQKKKNEFRWVFSELVEHYFDDFLYANNKKNYRGRQVVLQPNTPKFGYVIVDVIPPQLKAYNMTQGYKQTPFGTLYKINPEINLHIEVITFQQLIDAVETRHAPFFDKLFSSEPART